MVNEITADNIVSRRSSTIFLTAPAPFDFDHCLRFLNRNPNECLHQVDGQSWRKLLIVNEKKVLIQVEKGHKGLTINVLNTSLSLSEQALIVDYVREVFDLDQDYWPFYQSMEQDPLMSQLCRSYHGLRLIGIPELFEALSWSIIGQQINLSFAYHLKQRFVQAVGDKLSFQGTDYYHFPAPEKVAQMSPEDFSQWQYSNAKARYLIGVAQAFETGALSKSELRGKSLEETLGALLKLKGIGPWSAHYVMMKCLRIARAYPIGDVGLHNAIKLQLALEQKPSMDELQQWGAKWHPWEAYATFYLWHSLLK